MRTSAPSASASCGVPKKRPSTKKAITAWVPTTASLTPKATSIPPQKHQTTSRVVCR